MTPSDPNRDPDFPDGPDDPASHPRKRILMNVVLATAVFALGVLLLVLMLPGVLVQEKQLASEIDDALLRKAEQLEEHIANFSCAETAYTPRIIQPDAQPRADGGAGPRPPVVPAQMFPPVPNPPERTPVLPEVAEGRPDLETVAQLLDAAVVLVIGEKPETEEIAFGTGFAIGGGHIVTNHHVIDGVQRITVINDQLAARVEAEVVAAVPGNGLAEADLAVLFAEGTEDLPALQLLPFPADLQGVIAAGYPTFVTQTDMRFQQLIRGQGGAAPAMVKEPGHVTTIQNRDTDAPLVVHSATISPGNSGGPLVDECGRVVGINTFLRSGEPDTGGRIVYYAQPSKRLIDFLQAEGVEARVASGVCVAGTPQTSETEPETAATDPAAPGPTAPDPTDPEPTEPAAIPPASDPPAASPDAAPAPTPEGDAPRAGAPRNDPSRRDPGRTDAPATEAPGAEDGEQGGAQTAEPAEDPSPVDSW